MGNRPRQPLPTLPIDWLNPLLWRQSHIEYPKTYIGGGGGNDWTNESDLEEAIGRAIAATKPNGFGQRHRNLFEFARCLKAMPAVSDAEFGDLKVYVRRWHAVARPAIRTKSFEESWIDFAESWGKILHPKGTGPMIAIAEQARHQPLPAAALEYEQPELRQLVRLCKELQRNAGDKPFFLAVRTAGELLGVSAWQASRWLKLLVIDGILVRVRRGRHGRKASEYRYVAE